MRPLTASHAAHPTPSLDALAAELSANVVLILSTLPGGDLRVVRATTHANPALARAYAADGQYADAATWSAIATGQAVNADAYFDANGALRKPFTDQWLAFTNQQHAIVAPLAGPLLRGYPGAVVALGEKPFGDAALKRLDEVAKLIDADPSFSAPLRLGAGQSQTTRFFVIDESGTFVGGAEPTADGEFDQTLAEALVDYAKARVAKATPATGGERVLLSDASGQANAFTIAVHEAHPLAPKGGRVLMLCRVPGYAEWLEFRPADFNADQEIGRLLPAFRFMKERFHEGVTLPKIAGHVHLSPFHFHRRFTELLGITPKHFLYDCQIAKAQEMLLASTHELEEIARLCGFAHQSHFTSRFKQASGLTPTRWRRLKLTSDRGTTNLTPSRV